MMMCAASFCWMSFGLLVLWVLIASGLLFYTWNKVVCAQWSGRSPFQFYHALLVVLTILAFCLPAKYMKKRGGHYGKHSYKSRSYHDGSTTEKHGYRGDHSGCNHAWKNGSTTEKQKHRKERRMQRRNNKENKSE